jgi:hypothetical protein
MARGQRTPDDKRAEFAAKFLELGNASEAARQVGLSVHTGVMLARELEADADFTKAREDIHARALAEGELLLMRGMRKASERIDGCEPSKLDNGAWSDIGAAYLKSLADAYKALVQRAKNDADAKRAAEPLGGEAGVRRIEVVLTDKADEADQA